MAIHLIARGIDTTLEAYFLAGRPASATVTIRHVDDTNTLKTLINAAAATVDPVNTTLASLATKGAKTLTLNSVANIVPGRRYMVGTPGSSELHEEISPKSIAGNVVTLWAPLFFDHAINASFAGLRVSYTVLGTATANTNEEEGFWKDGSIVWTPASGDPIPDVVHCVKFKIPEIIFSLADVRLEHPKLGNLLDPELDWPHAQRVARDNVLEDLGGDLMIHGVASSRLQQLGAKRFLLNRAASFGQGYAEDIVQLKKTYAETLNAVRALTPADVNKDGRLGEVDDEVRWGVI